jgi:hypothetical protein
MLGVGVGILNLFVWVGVCLCLSITCILVYVWESGWVSYRAYFCYPNTVHLWCTLCMCEIVCMSCRVYLCYAFTVNLCDPALVYTVYVWECVYVMLSVSLLCTYSEPLWSDTSRNWHSLSFDYLTVYTEVFTISKYGNNHSVIWQPPNPALFQPNWLLHYRSSQHSHLL